MPYAVKNVCEYGFRELTQSPVAAEVFKKDGGRCCCVCVGGGGGGGLDRAIEKGERLTF